MYRIIQSGFLVLILSIFATPDLWADPIDPVDEIINAQESELHEDDIYDIRHADRQPGLYLMKDAVHSTTTQPLSSLDPQSVEPFLKREVPVEGYGVAIVNPTFFLSAEIKKKLKAEGHSLPRVLIIRRPQSMGTHLLDVPMRRQDIVPTSRQEISTATMTDVLDTSAGAVAAFLTLPWEAATLVTGGAYIMGGVFYYVLPSHLNHWNRLNVFKLSLWQFTLSLGISLGFRSLALTGLGTPEDIFADGWLEAIAISSAINTGWRPFVGKAIATWRDKYLSNPIENLTQRWGTSGRLYLLGTMMGGPAFIYSNLPVAKEIFRVSEISINHGHLGMAITAGLFALAWNNPKLLDLPAKTVNQIAKTFAPVNRVWMWPLERTTDGILAAGRTCRHVLRQFQRSH